MALSFGCTERQITERNAMRLSTFNVQLLPNLTSCDNIFKISKELRIAFSSMSAVASLNIWDVSVGLDVSYEEIID